jgi:hypothetical protein
MARARANVVLIGAQNTAAADHAATKVQVDSLASEFGASARRAEAGMQAKLDEALARLEAKGLELEQRAANVEAALKLSIAEYIQKVEEELCLLRKETYSAVAEVEPGVKRETRRILASWPRPKDGENAKPEEVQRYVIDLMDGVLKALPPLYTGLAKIYEKKEG